MALKLVKPPHTSPRMRSTNWLSSRLGISVSTIEKLRSQGSNDIPPHLHIGRRFLYDEASVERWISSRLSQSNQVLAIAGGNHEG